MFDKYTVLKDETLDIVADKFNTTPDILKNINNIYFDEAVKEGMELVVPKTKELYYDYYTVEKGDSIYGIAKKYNINPVLLIKLNGLNMDDYIYPNEKIMIPKSGYSYYVTAEGDTIDIVADTFGVAKDKLLAENETIYLLPDQVLVVKR